MNGETSAVVTVLTTAPDAQVAETLGRTLVEERLAACASVIPGVRSIYWWEGEVQVAGEAMVLLKTTVEHADSLTARMVELHPYDVPEVLTLPVTGGHEPYLSWVGAEVGDPHAS
jgi:periplasmic divalent cation tolerance protein